MVQTGDATTATPQQSRAGRRAILTACVIASLAPLVTAGSYHYAMRVAGVDTGFPLDDSWIHTQYARTLVEGRPFEYVPGERSIGTTSVLFDVVWAAATLVTGEYVHTIHILNVLLTAGVGVLLVMLLLRYRVPPLTAGVGAGLIVASYPFPWSSLSGMETALATWLTVAAVLAHVSWAWAKGWRPLVGPVLMALAAMTRPENLILFPLSELDHLLMRWLHPETVRREKAAWRLALRVAAFGLTMLPYFALNYSVHGTLVPNTYEAKVGRLRLGADIQSEGLQALGLRFKKMLEVPVDAIQFIADDDNKILMVLAGVGVLACFVPRLRRGPGLKSLFPLLVFFGGTAAAGVVTLGVFFPGQSQRYLIQWIPLALVFGVVGMDLVARAAGAIVPRAARPAYAAAVALLALADVAGLAQLYPGQVDNYITSVKNINEMQVAIGEWVNANTPPGAVVATNDIGAIAFFGDRPVLDTIGLIDPEVVRRKRLPDHTRAMLEYLRQKRVTHALLFPSWHPDLILDSRFKPVHRVVLDDNVICGDARMVVMQVDWHGQRQDHEAPAWWEEEQTNCRRWLRLLNF